MFRCKQFTINDSQCAMKVSTDALILGSWADPKHAKRILDIGCGSGILSLMMLQKKIVDAQVHGIDIHPDAVAQTKVNVMNSPWSKQAIINHSDIVQMTDGDYEFIISNPPYFNESVNAANKTMGETRRVARHQSSLSYTELLKRAFAVSTQHSRLVVMYPYDLLNKIVHGAQSHGWYLQKCQNVRSKSNLQPYLTLFEFTKNNGSQSVFMDDLIIRIKDDYSSEFKMLCRDFYLKF